MSELNRQPCCATWAAAHARETDSEGWLALIHRDGDMRYPAIGMGLPPVCFCPWCAAPKTVQIVQIVRTR